MSFNSSDCAAHNVALMRRWSQHIPQAGLRASRQIRRAGQATRKTLAGFSILQSLRLPFLILPIACVSRGIMRR